MACDGASGVTVIMAASQAVDPGSTPGWRNESVANLYFYSFVSFSGTGVSLLSSPKLFSATIIVTHVIGGQTESVGSPEVILFSSS